MNANGHGWEFAGRDGSMNRLRRVHRTRSTLWIAAACSILTGLILTGCQSTNTTSASDPETVIHHTWWNYYKRGTYYLEQDKVAEAQADFERSLGVRAGAKYGFPEDMWRANTYGMHFLDHYFPNRELGICLYKQGNLKDAETYLSTSLEQEPSGRAKFYLNRVRADLNIAAALPNPTLATKANVQDQWTNLKSIKLSVSSEAKGFIKDVVINHERQFIELATPTYSTTQDIKLRSGRNEIPVRVADLNGRQTTTNLLIEADWDAPAINIDRIMVFPGYWVAKCICSDNGSLGSITLNGKSLMENPAGEIKTAHSFEVRFDQAHTPTLVVTDLAGNRIEEIFSPVLAKTALNKYDGKSVFQGLENGFQYASTVSSSDRQPPFLRIEGAGRIHTVYDEEFYVDGQAQDGSGIASLTLNGEELLYSETKNPQSSRFGRRVSLNPGTNIYCIVAADTLGNETRKELMVISKKPEFEQDEYRLTVGVPPMISEAKGFGRQIKYVIEDELLRSPIRFRLLERDEGWDFILREQQLNMSDLADPSVSIKICRMLPAELLLMSSLVEHGGGQSVVMKVVDSVEGEIIHTDDIYLDTSSNEVDYQIGGLILKLKQQFPVVSGRVTKVSKNKVTIDIGRDNGVNAWSRFVVLKSDPPDAPLNETTVQKQGERFIQLKIERVRPDSGVAEILPSEGCEGIREGDYVYAR